MVASTVMSTRPVKSKSKNKRATPRRARTRAAARKSVEVASPLDALGAFGLPAVVGSRLDSEAPALPLTYDEPAPVSRLDPRDLCPDQGALAGLQRLVGPAADPVRCGAALQAALSDEPYNPRDLPDARAMLLGLARVLVHSGVPRDALVQAIVDAMLE